MYQASYSNNVQYQGIAAFIASGTSTTSPLDGTPQVTTGTVDGNGNITCPSVTPSANGDIGVSFAAYNGGDDYLQSANVTIPPSVYSGQAAFAYSGPVGFNTFAPAFTNGAAGQGVACVSLLLH